MWYPDSQPQIPSADLSWDLYVEQSFWQQIACLKSLSLDVGILDQLQPIEEWQLEIMVCSLTVTCMQTAEKIVQQLSSWSHLA